VLGALKAAQDQHEHEKAMKDKSLHSDADIFGDDNWSPPPKPKARPASPPPPKPTPKPKAQAAPKPAPKPEPKPESKPESKPKPKAAPNRAPPTPGGGSLDDLFGGAGEGRLRIGKRTKPKPDEE
jgi:outer membrane biosynthesis protein TonB